jgi:hypothetical protein
VDATGIAARYIRDVIATQGIMLIVDIMATTGRIIRWPIEWTGDVAGRQ